MVGRRRVGGLIWLLVCFILAVPCGWTQDQAPKVAILPLVIHGQQDAARSQKALEDIFSRLLTAEQIRVIDSQEVHKVVPAPISTEDQARSAGSRLGAGFVLFGSFNQVGNAISIDAKLVDVSGKKTTTPLYAEDKGMENLAAAVGKIVQEMSIHVLSKAVIADVKVRGNDRIEADAIKSNVKSKKGELLKPEQVSDDIRSIYKMGFFEKVDAEVADSPAGKVLTFAVQENPSVQEVRITGQKKIKEKDILAAIGTKAYTVLQRNLVSEDVQKILKLYQQKGYYNAEVKSKIEFPKDPRRATVTFEIKENKKVWIREVAFTGNKNLSSRKLRSVMQTQKKNWLLSLFTERGILQRDILDTDIDRLTAYYHDEGYMDAKVSSPVVTLKEDGFHINITVDEGQRYKVTDVRISGDLIEGYEKKIVKKFELKPKAYFSREKVRHDIDLVTKTYMSEGYARAEVEPQIKRNPEEHTTDINFHVTQHEIVHIGQIFITGNTKTRDNVIRRELLIAEGDMFSSKKIEDSLAKLKKLDFFEDVEITPTDTDTREIMNLHVKVKEKLTGSISVGGGYSSQDGMFISGQIQQKNLWGKGDLIAFKGYLGQEAQRYMISYTHPWMFGHPVTGGIDLYNWVRAYEDFTTDSYGFRLRASYPVGQWSHLNLFYLWENAKIYDLDTAAQNDPYFQNSLNFRIKSSIGGGFERDTTDHPFLPTKGTYAGVTVEYASSALGSDSDFFKHEYHAGVYQPLGIWKFIGHLRGAAGFMEELNGESDVPLYERFYLGGINSLRGFEFGEVGPKDANGIVIGGTKYVVMNAELLFPIVEKYGMRGVIFYDAGNAYGESASIDFSKLRTDVGAGIRWNSPFGPLRVEVGYNLDREDGEKPYQWQFSAGAFF